jgi:predicted GIY-YIG superfamily endonuclease
MAWKKIAGIYILTNRINGKMYIGQSTDLSQRINKYKNGNIKGQTRIYDAIVKYLSLIHISEPTRP